jgi:hypothetical protein
MSTATASITPSTAAVSPRSTAVAVADRLMAGIQRPSSIARKSDGAKIATVATTAPGSPPTM